MLNVRYEHVAVAAIWLTLFHAHILGCMQMNKTAWFKNNNEVNVNGINKESSLRYNRIDTTHCKHWMWSELWNGEKEKHTQPLCNIAFNLKRCQFDKRNLFASDSTNKNTSRAFMLYGESWDSVLFSVFSIVTLFLSPNVHHYSSLVHIPDA